MAKRESHGWDNSNVALLINSYNYYAWAYSQNYGKLCNFVPARTHACAHPLPPTQRLLSRSYNLHIPHSSLSILLLLCTFILIPPIPPPSSYFSPLSSLHLKSACSLHCSMLPPTLRHTLPLHMLLSLTLSSSPSPSLQPMLSLCTLLLPWMGKWSPWCRRHCRKCSPSHTTSKAPVG